MQNARPANGRATHTQAEGAAQQIKGKAEKAWNNVKDAVRDLRTDAEREREKAAESHDRNVKPAAGGIGHDHGKG